MPVVHIHTLTHDHNPHQRTNRPTSTHENPRPDTHTHTHTHTPPTHLEIHPQVPRDRVAHAGLPRLRVRLADEVVDVEQVPLPEGVTALWLRRGGVGLGEGGEGGEVEGALGVCVFVIIIRPSFKLTPAKTHPHPRQHLPTHRNRARASSSRRGPCPPA